MIISGLWPEIDADTARRTKCFDEGDPSQAAVILGGQNRVIERAFEEMFRKATVDKGGAGESGYTPLPYQAALATDGMAMPVLLDVPTGLGKTAGAVVAWLWRRRFDPRSEVREQTPRRLIYCLPMRVLVEQTHGLTTKWLANLGLLANDENESPEWLPSASDRGHHPIAVHLLLGGAEKSDWALWPERDAILIGTQDMLLSRTLNRGYAAGRARWPLEFGFLNNDCQWVFDEIQIMDTGLATSLQFDAWRGSLPLRKSRSDFPAPTTEPTTAKPCHSLWMSATMAQHWLKSAVDWSPRTADEWSKRSQLTEPDRSNLRIEALFKIEKVLNPAGIELEKPKTKDGKSDSDQKQLAYLKKLADRIRDPQNRDSKGLTLVILNTVDRATGLFKLLDEASLGVPIRLIHSRFRPIEREGWREFLAQKDGSPRILISTQVVEAGVDLSAGVLYTELAPWASLVQRFGRCARYPGESGKVFWLDLGIGKKEQPIDCWAKPYGVAELFAAREKLKASLKDVGLSALAAIKTDIDRADADAKALYPYEPRFVPREKDLFDLFDTTPDLTGADVDVSRFIRDGDELDIQVFWRDLDGGAPTKKYQPERRELCSVPFYRFRVELDALRKDGRMWRLNYRKGWEAIDARDRDQIYPGQVYLLEKSCGGYSPTLGWTGNPGDSDFQLPGKPDETIAEREARQDAEDDADDLSQMSQIDGWLSVLAHTRDVCVRLDAILRECDVSGADKKILRLAARWHDRGKAHKVFQSKLRPEMLTAEATKQRLASEPAAKAPEEAWQNGSRLGFRHELASALAILETLYGAQPQHQALAWPDGLTKSDFGDLTEGTTPAVCAGDPLAEELGSLSPDELDLLVYLVAAHHGKVRMSIRSSPTDDSTLQKDRCPSDKRQARGVRDGDEMRACQIPSADLGSALVAPQITLTLDPMELGLSQRYGASWRERMQFLLERMGPFRLAYLEGLLRAADCRASAEEDGRTAGANRR